MADNTMKFLDLAGLQKLWARIGEVFVKKADITDDLAKLEGIQVGAQVNKVETLQVTNGTDKLTFANDPENSTTWVIKNVTNLEDGQANILAPTAKAVKDAIDVVAKSVTDKNVSAEGDDYIAASTDSNKVAVSATEKTKAAIALAETALQKADITTGGANGTIAVDGTDVAVQGLGSAAFTESTAYDAAGAATTAAAGALTSAQSYTDNKLRDLGLTKALGSAAFTETTAYDAAGSAAKALADAKADTTTQIAALDLPNTYDAKGAAATALADAKDYTNGKIDEVKALVTASTQFLGVADNAIVPETTATIKVGGKDVTAGAGDIVLYGTSEFIWDGAKWVLLGDTTAEMDAITDLQTAVNTTLPKAIEDAQAAAEAYADGLAKNYDAAGSAAAAETAAKAYADSLAKNYDAAGSAADALAAAEDYTDSVVGDLGTATTVKDYVDAAKDAAINAAAENITQDAANAALPKGAFNLVSEVSTDGKKVAAKYYKFEKISDAEIAALV